MEQRLEYFREYNRKRYSSPEARAAELERGREKYARLGRDQRVQRKRRLILLMGGKCVRCGYDRSGAAMDFHHRKGEVKLRTVSHLLAINQAWGWDAAIEEAKKCELLCSNCHREETYPGHELDIPEADF